MKRIFMVPLLCALALATPAFAQDETAVSADSSTTSGNFSDIRSMEQPIFVTLALGPAFSTGLESDALLLNLFAAVNRNFTENLSGKVFGDGALGPDQDSARLLTFGAGADFYPTARRFIGALPYVAADAGLGLARNGDDETQNGLAVAGGGGLRFASRAFNWDLSLHYRAMMVELEGSTPSVLSIRGGMNF